VQRRARTYVTGVALVAVLSGGLTACTGSSGDDGEDTKAGDPTASAPSAPPGRYRTLPEPCGSVDRGTLKKLLPGAEAAQGASEDESGSSGKGPGGGTKTSPYEGDAIVTYDTDRRVGCRWRSATTLATRHLAVDFERVVSYDPSVSDDEQAELLYDERAGQAEIPTDSNSADDGGDGGDGSGDGGDGGDKTAEKEESGEDGEGDDGKGGGDSSKSEKSDSASPDPEDSEPGSSPSSDADLSPRMLTDIGDSAYIDDQLDTGDSGVHRDITLVFRSANVIATVKYDQWLTDKRRTPDSAELQEKALTVAERLAAQFDDN
jgi:hypothetical protein